jgi:hypothetical protein
MKRKYEENALLPFAHLRLVLLPLLLYLCSPIVTSETVGKRLDHAYLTSPHVVRLCTSRGAGHLRMTSPSLEVSGVCSSCRQKLTALVLCHTCELERVKRVKNSTLLDTYSTYR